MKTDDLTASKATPIRQDALPELSTIRSALSNDSNIDNEAQTAIDIANSAAREWNHSRQSEVSAAKSLQSDDVQSAMAAEVFAAFMTYLKTIPSGVQHKVVAKFHAINLPDGHKGVITL